MVRFVIGPDQTVVPDLEEKLPGKGLWLSADRDMIHTACAKNLFAKRARCRAVVDPDLAGRVEDLLVRRCTALLQMARRAGQLTIGFDEVRRRLADGDGGQLLAASDGGPGGREKITALARETPASAALTGDELGRSMGRERIAHALVAPGRLARRLGRELDRLAGLRSSATAA